MDGCHKQRPARVSPFRGLQNATYCDGNCEDLILRKIPLSRSEIAIEFQLKCFMVLGKFKLALQSGLVLDDKGLAKLLSRGVPSFFGLDMSTKLSQSKIFNPLRM